MLPDTARAIVGGCRPERGARAIVSSSKSSAGEGLGVWFPGAGGGAPAAGRGGGKREDGPLRGGGAGGRPDMGLRSSHETAAGRSRAPLPGASLNALTGICLREHILWMLTTFDVVAEPHRRRILDLLRASDRAVGELVDELGIAQPAVSKHLRVLRDAHLVTAEVDGQRRLYRLQADPLQELDAWVAPYRAHWERHLDALTRHLDKMGKPAPARGRRR